MLLQEINRLEPTLSGKRFELEDPEPQKVEIAETLQRAFDGVAPQISATHEQVVRKIMWNETVHHALTKAEMFREFADKFGEIKALRSSLSNFTEEIVRVNFETRGMAANQVGPIVDWAVAKGRFDVPMIGVGQQAEIAVKPAEEVLVILNGRLKDATYLVLNHFLGFLEALKKQEQIGEIQFLSPTVCKFYFHRWIVKDEVLTVRHGQPVVRRERLADGSIREVTLKPGEKDVQRTFTHGLHYHELMNAERLSWDDTTLPKPERVRDFLSRIPTLLRPFVEIVTGDEILRRVVEHDVESQKITEKFADRKEVVYRPRDPAVVLGSYVLTGWAPGEA